MRELHLMSRLFIRCLLPPEGGWQLGAEVPWLVNWWHVLGMGLLLLSAAVTCGAIAVIWWLLA